MNKRVVKKIVIFDAERETLLATESAKTKSSSNRKRKLDNDANNITNNNNNAKKRKLSNQEASQSKVAKTAPNPKRVSKTKNNRADARIGTNELINIPSKERTKSKKQTSVGKTDDEVEDAPITREAEKNEQIHTPIKRLSSDDISDLLPLNTGEDQNKEFETCNKKFNGALKDLEATECEINGARITLNELCDAWRIDPLTSSITMDLPDLSWTHVENSREVRKFIDDQIIPQLAKIIECSQKEETLTRKAFGELRKMIANKIADKPLFEKKLEEVFPNIANWEQKLTKSPRASQQDFTSLYSTLFDPFFQDIPLVKHSIIPLPAPFEQFKRAPDMRAFVVKNGVEFTYFIREDCRESTSSGVHRLVQLMRCALKHHIAHLRPTKEYRSVYCFGILTCGYKIQLLQMQVRLFNVKNYELPIYELWVEDELDLSNFDEESVATLLRWLAAIYLYYLALEHSPNESQLRCTTGDTAQPNLIRPLSNRESRRTHEEFNQETLDAISDGIINDEAVVLQENVKYHKRVLAVCTTVNRIRMFAVKIYGAECTYMNEVDILKIIGPHPNICQILAVTKLKSGETMVVQPWYEDYGGWRGFEKQDKFPSVFLQLAKGLSHMHERGVIHGDIKPGNFLVDSECNTRIIDFDFSTRIEDAHKLGGTDGYRAPEWYTKYLNQTGEGPLTVKFDIWSLAVTMCQYAGVDFGDVDNSLERRVKILENLKSKRFLLWPVRELLKQMLSIRPNDRPSASEVFDELVRVYGDRGIAANEKTCQLTLNKQHEDSHKTPRQHEKDAISNALNRSTNHHERNNDENRDQRALQKGQRLALVNSTVKRNKDRRGILNDVTNIVK